MLNETITDEEFVEAMYRRFLLREADASGKQNYLAALAAANSRIDVVQSIVTSGEFFDLLCQQRFGPQTGTPFLRAVPPAHFYSPLPSMDAVDALAREAESFDPSRCPGIDLRITNQLELLGELASCVSGLCISDGPTSGRRFYADNGSFAPGDALLLAAIILWARPARILEIGAGFSTALMLDVMEERLPGRVSLESVDPEPARLRSLLLPGDEQKFYLREGLVQDLSAADFAQLRANDILFIDSRM